MNPILKKLPKSQIEFEIEISAEEFNRFINQAIFDLGKDLEIKGFRKGKAPKEIIEKEIGQGKILIEAADLAAKENYKKAILENKIEPIAPPEIKIKKLSRGDSFIFLAKTSVLPEIKLPDYKKIAAQVKKKEITVEEKEIDDACRRLQKSRAKLSLKNQPAQKGDFVEIEYRSSQLDGSESPSPQKDAFILGEGHFLPGFEEQLIGMKDGEEKKGISLTIPEGHLKKDLAGKKIVLEVKMKSVQKIEFPEINDQFAQGLGNFENLSALRKDVKEGLGSEKGRAESQKARNEILDKISETADCEIPEGLVEGEQKRMIESLEKNVSEKLNISFENYLAQIKKSKKELLDSFLAEAKKGVKNFLILREIGKKEKIEVSEEEIKEEVSKTLTHYPNAEQARKNLDLEGFKEYTKERIYNEKVFQLLEGLISNP